MSIMSSLNPVSLNRRLDKLNQWQIEQDTKLKGFQESQKRLLGFELESIWRSLGVSKDKLTNVQEDDSNKENQAPGLKGQSFLRSKEMLNDGCASSRETKELKMEGEEEKNEMGDCGGQWSERVWRGAGKKTFLRRGAGLARFRMTPEDFKTPPKIYRDKHLRVLKKKTEPRKKGKGQATLANGVGHAGHEISAAKTVGKKKTGIEVNVHVKGDKSLGNSTKEVSLKAGSSSNSRDFACVKASFPACKKPAVEVVPNSWGKFCRKTIPPNPIDKCLNLDIEDRRDENELKVFEILEEKVNESSFCSSSSLIDRLLNPQEMGNPAPGGSRTFEKTAREPETSGSAGFVPVPSRLDDLVLAPTATEFRPSVDKVPSDQAGINSRERLPVNSVDSKAGEEVFLDGKLKLEKSERAQHISRRLENHKKILGRRLTDRKFDPPTDDSGVLLPPDKAGKEVPAKPELELKLALDQKEMAAKLRRKGLQDNVKQLMIWDGSPRKKCVKRNVVRKSKPKFKKPEKPKPSCKEESEKVVFNSTLLKDRLNELEQEILIFRKESSSLEKIKRECQEERMRLIRERKEFEKRMEEEKNILVTAVAEDRRKLQKERLVFETYSREARSRPPREERQQVSCLKRDLEKMAETLATKEARWGASQARLRNQLRTLESENLRLRAENEKLKKAGPKRVSFGSGKVLSAKIIRAVNTELDKLNSTTGSLVRNCNCGGPRSCFQREKKQPLRRIMSAPNMKESNTSGSRCATPPDSRASTSSGHFGGCQNCPGDSDGDACDESEIKYEEGDSDKSPDRGTGLDVDVVDAVVRDVLLEKLESKDPRASQYSSAPNYPDNPSHCSDVTENNGDSRLGTAAAVPAFEENLTIDTEKVISNAQMTVSRFAESPFRRPFSCREEGRTLEKRLEDGTREIIYPNGNVKRIFPDNKIVRILYYNGDVKEVNFEEGNEKYYYSETQTWHMSYRDGMDVVEFPTGQTERRYPDGSSEISFPNGCMRYCDASGRDEWRFPDGTVMKTNEKGHKVLIMANGQKEIRTNEFKQREYPDGTIRIVYSNGTQETRYASGRVRLKDGDGNLVLDSGGERI